MALLIPIYLWVFTGTFTWLFPAFLILAGLAVSRDLLKQAINTIHPQKEKSFLASMLTQDPEKIEKKNQFNHVIYYTLLAVGLLTLLVEVEPRIFRSQVIGLELTGIDGILFGIMMAVGEEQLFRTGITNWLLQHFKVPFVVFLSSAGIFLIYHLAIYGDTMYALIYVFSAGLIMAYVDEMSGVDTPSKIAHITNNILAYAGATLTGLFGEMFRNSQILILIASFTLLIYILMRKRKVVVKI